MSLLQYHDDEALIQRTSMFQVAVKAAARHKFGLAFHTSHKMATADRPVGWVGEQYREAWKNWDTDPLTFPTFYYNIGIPINEVWPVRNDAVILWTEAVHSQEGLGRLAKLYIGGGSV